MKTDGTLSGLYRTCGQIDGNQIKRNADAASFIL